MALIKCKECGNDLSKTARRCPHCGHYIWTSGRIGCAGIVLFIALSFSLPFLSSQCSDKSTKQTASEPSEPTSVDAYIAANRYVKLSLKNPHTANFNAHIASDIKKLDGDIWEVNSYVDAKNDFNADIRLFYRVKMQYDGNNKFRLIDINLSR